MKGGKSNANKTIEQALESLRRGGFVVLFDSSDREGEADIFLAAQHSSAQKIADMRKFGGGLFCVALGEKESAALGLPFMDELMFSSGSVKRELVLKKAKYGDKSAFSVSVNHRDTFTGVTDKDRSTTVKALARMAALAGMKKSGASTFYHSLPSIFASEFKAPGHVQLLRSRGLVNRHGHTEMAIALAGLAGIAPAVALCEILDGRTGRAMNESGAKALAKRLKAPFLRGRDVLAVVRK